MSIRCSTPYHEELSRIEAVRNRLSSVVIPVPAGLDRLTVNPALELFPVLWHGLQGQLDGKRKTALPPERGEELVLIWRSPHDSQIHVEQALPADLLALKVILEGTDPTDAACKVGVPVGVIDQAIMQAIRRGVILSPSSRICRPASFHSTPVAGKGFLTARVFTLQWHITQDCDLSCSHCYDRSKRSAVTLGDGMRILDDLRLFCLDRFVRGQVSFSGGNPFLHPDFTNLYRAAAERGLATAILGNPSPRERLVELLAIQRPEYVQVSLEGLEGHNDLMRGNGHFRRTLVFLDLLSKLGIPSEVMLTLTSDNMAEVLPLGELLRGRADAFTFNRLALFGAGAQLSMPGREDYAAFLASYLAAMPGNTVLALKDSLFNTVLLRQGDGLFDGCTGYGCGAAFNFVALLPDGEVHACRKFPSPIGNIVTDPLAVIYDSASAAAYREGSSACTDCDLRPVCRGCPAVTVSKGGNPFTDRDPYCNKCG